MITTKRLFFRRMVSEWKYQFSVVRTAIDWTVALYIILPPLIYGIVQYVTWWKTSPVWFSFIQFELIVGFLFFFTWTGTYRIFLEDADQLFLFQKTRWIKDLTGLSLIYSFSFNLFLTIILFILLAPLLLYFKLSFQTILFFLLLTILFKYIIGLAKQMLGIRLKGWPKRFAQIILFLGCGAIFRIILNLPVNTLAYLILSLLLVGILGFLIRMRLNLRGSFFEDVSRELDLKLRYVVLFLRAAGINIKKQRTSRKRPLLFRSSNQIFRDRNPVNGLVETCIKSVLRNPRHLQSYGLILLFASLIILTLPLKLKLIFWIVFAFLFTVFVDLYWQEINSDPFVNLFQWKKDVLVAAEKKSLLFIMLPGFWITSVIVGFQTYSWFGALVFIPVAYFMVSNVINLVTMFMALRRQL